MMRLSCSCSRNTWTSARILPFSASMNCVSSFCTISASENCPSQSSRMMRPVPSTRIVPSGKSTTGASVVPPQRHPAANFGTLASVSSPTLPLDMFRAACRVGRNSKRARRWPSWLNISEIERVELRPKNVTLVAQEKFGQRGSDAFQKRPRPHQVEILISNKARGGQNLVRTHNPLLIEPGRFRQLDPALDSASAMLVAVMIHNAFAPDAPERWIGRPRKNDRVLHRNNRLVVITVQRPGL